MIAIIVSKKDKAGMNIASFLEKQTLETMMLTFITWKQTQ